jgi:hypothetical protein
MADAAAEEERLKLAAATHRMLKRRSYDWWMYDCPVERLAGSVGRGCGELQEGAISKSATFFARENTLPTEHGSPKVGAPGSTSKQLPVNNCTSESSVCDLRFDERL